MVWIFHHVFQAFVDGRLAQAVFAGKNCGDIVAQFVLHAFELASHIALMDSQQLCNFPELESILVTPEQDQALARSQSLTGAGQRIFKNGAIAVCSYCELDVVQRWFVRQCRLEFHGIFRNAATPRIDGAIADHNA